MAAVTRNSATTEVSILIDWIALSIPENGYSDVTAYNLQWDKGTYGSSTIWYDLYGTAPPQTSIAFTLTSDISAGVTYYFRIRAINVHGEGLWSNETTIKAAGIPSTPATISTSIVTSNGKVRITWVAPHDGS